MLKPKINWSYLAGIIDGEGHISDSKKCHIYQVVIVNTDYELLKVLYEFLIEQNLKPIIYERKTKTKICHKDSYILYIGGWNNIKIISQKCPIFSYDKRKRLQDIVKHFKNKKTKIERIMAFVKIIKENPNYSYTKCAKILNEHRDTFYRWKIKDYL